ncbi:MAG: thioredoxin family protein [Pseudomonadota bacterium]
MPIVRAVLFSLAASVPTRVQAEEPAWQPPPPLVTLGTLFQELPIDKVLARARQEHQAVLVVVLAAECESCQRLDREVLSTARGSLLSDRALAVRLQVEDGGSQDTLQRYAVIDWPTTLVLRPDGSEIGRIETFDGVRAYERELTPLLDGRSPLTDCQHRLERDRGNVRALFCVGKAELDHNQPRRGFPLLEEVLARDPENRNGVTDRSLFVMGRYLALVKRDPRQARQYFRELDARFGSTPHGKDAAWWYARSLHRMDRTELGWLYLETRAHRLRSRDAVADLGRYALTCKVHQQEALTQVRRAVVKHPRDGELKRLMDKLARALL